MKWMNKFGGKALIVCPFGVKQEFAHDAVHLLGYPKPAYVRNMEEATNCSTGIMITNYERVRDGDIDPAYFMATSLEVMDTGQALTRFFQRDSTKANNLTLYPNMEDEFWIWISSWALFVTKPSDLNPDYSDEGYVLPPLDVRWHELSAEYGKFMDRDGQMCIFSNAAAGLKEAARVKRESIPDPAATFRNTATGRYFSVLIMSLMILFRRFTGATDFCRKSRW